MSKFPWKTCSNCRRPYLWHRHAMLRHAKATPTFACLPNIVLCTPHLNFLPSPPPLSLAYVSPCFLLS